MAIVNGCRHRDIADRPGCCLDDSEGTGGGGGGGGGTPHPSLNPREGMTETKKGK
jgi:hypothetical protein